MIFGAHLVDSMRLHYSMYIQKSVKTNTASLRTVINKITEIDGASSGGKRWRWAKTLFSCFLPAAFRKVQKIGIGLKSNGTSNIAGLLSKNSIHETWKRLGGSRLYRHFFVFYTCKWTFTRRFSFSIFRHYQALFAQVYSVRITPIYLLCSYQDSFVNMITTSV